MSQNNFISNDADLSISSQSGDGANNFNSYMLRLEEEGICLLHEGRFDDAEEKFQKLEKLAAASGDESWIASARSGLGVALAARGDFAGAEKMYRDAIAIDEKLENIEGQARDYSNFASFTAKRGDLEGAETMFKKSLEFCRRAGLMNMLAGVYGNLGMIYKTRKDFNSAKKMYLDSLALYEEFGQTEGIAYQCSNLGGLYLECKDYDSARTMLTRAFALNQELGLMRNIASDHYNFGVLHRALGENEKAVEMFKKAFELCLITGNNEMAAAAMAELKKFEKAAHKDANLSAKNKSTKQCPEAVAPEKSAFSRSERPSIINTGKFPFEIEAERRQFEENKRTKSFVSDKLGLWLEFFFDSLPAPHKTRPERPDTITVDFNTPFETFLGITSLGCLIVSMFFFWKGFFGNLSLRGFTSPPDHGLIVYAILAAVLGAILITIRLYMDNYFFIDKTDNKIYFQFRCFSFNYMKTFLNGSEIEAFGVSGRPARNARKYAGRKSPGPNGEDGWEYCVCIIDRNGNIIKFGDFGSGNLHGLNLQAINLAKAMQSQVFENSGRSVLCVKMDAGAPVIRFEYENCSLKMLFTKNDIVNFLIFLAVFSILIYAAFGR